MSRRAWLAAGVAATVALGGWAVWRSVRARPASAPPAGGLPDGVGPGAGPAREPSASDLLASRYNAVLQVRCHDAQGEPQPVGTALPRRLSLVFQDGEGRAYAEQFDRVGLWAIEFPPGTYVIPASQSGLGEWRWKVSGEGVRRRGGEGWTVTFHAERMNPTIDLLLY